MGAQGHLLSMPTNNTLNSLSLTIQLGKLRPKGVEVGGISSWEGQAHKPMAAVRLSPSHGGGVAHGGGAFHGAGFPMEAGQQALLVHLRSLLLGLPGHQEDSTLPVRATRSYTAETGSDSRQF